MIGYKIFKSLSKYINGSFYFQTIKTEIIDNKEKIVERKNSKSALSSSDLLLSINSIKHIIGNNNLRRGKILQNIFDACAYHGKTDGHCIVVWNYKLVRIIGRYNKEKNRTTLDTKKLYKAKTK